MERNNTSAQTSALKCAVCLQTAYKIYKHRTEPVYFCSVTHTGKYNNINKADTSTYNQMIFQSQPRTEFLIFNHLIEKIHSTNSY